MMLGKILGIGVLARVILMVYGAWQDASFALKYTDIDYNVFSDAANLVVLGHSPYDRATYRYTPLLAYLLTGNFIWDFWGKILFIICDIIVALLIYKTVIKNGASEQQAIVSICVWLFNPLTATISSRGNAESLIAVPVLLTFFLLSSKQSLQFPFTTGLIYGLCVHLKIYPIIYLPIIYLNQCSQAHESHSPWSKKVKDFISISWPRTVFVISAVLINALLLAVFYNWYGSKFIQETYLYHVTRKDIKHNFSPYFLLLYYSVDSSYTHVMGLLLFAPQALLLVTVALKYHRDLLFACFMATYVFVTFNKVCTSQYFIWYISLLPLITPNLKFSTSQALCLTVLWFFGQAQWLLPAYLLEFEGWNTYLWIGLAGIVFMVINVYIMNKICCHYQPANEITARPHQD